MRNLVAVCALALLTSGAALAQDAPRTTSPVLTHEEKPVYTGEAVRRKVSGVVDLTVVVLADGTVGSVAVTKALDPDLDDAAIRAVKQWTFKPGTRDGVPVAVSVMAEVTFTLRDSAQPIVYRIGEPGLTAPVATTRVEAQYTDQARRAGVRGTVTLEGIVRPNGMIDGILVKKELEPGLDQAATAALTQWRFKPGTKDGKAVSVIVSIEMSFDLK